MRLINLGAFNGEDHGFGAICYAAIITRTADHKTVRDYGELKMQAAAY